MADIHWTKAVSALGSEGRLLAFLPDDAGVTEDEPESLTDHPTLDKAFTDARAHIITHVANAPVIIAEDAILPSPLDTYEIVIAMYFLTLFADRKPAFVTDNIKTVNEYLLAASKGYISISGFPVSGDGSAGGSLSLSTTDAGDRHFDTDDPNSLISVRMPDL